MTVLCIIQAVVIAVLAFAWHRQRAQLAWVDERDQFLGPIMDNIQIAVAVNAPTHSKSEIDGVMVGGTLMPSKVGIQQLWVVYDQLQAAWGTSRRAVNAMGTQYGMLRNWEATHPVPGPKWVCWPYKVRLPESEEKVVEAEATEPRRGSLLPPELRRGG